MNEPGKGCLHLVMNAHRGTLTDCLACCGPEDTVVLLSSAVDWLARPLALPEIATTTKVCCLAADTRAHGLQDLPSALGLAVIDDHELVRLVCSHRHCMSWK